VYKNTLATVIGQMQQAENPILAKVIRTEAGCVDNTIHLHDLTSEVALEEPEIGSTDPDILIDNNWTYGKLHFGMERGCEEYNNEGYKIVKSDAIPTTSWWWMAATEHKRFNLGTGDQDWYEGDNGDNADGNQEEDASQADDGLMQTSQDWGYSTSACEDWT
jgi:hypothetical protein